MNAMLRGVLFTSLLVTILLHATAPVHAADGHLRAGAASITITPDGPIWMAGYSSRDRPSQGVAQDLFAKALAVEDTRGTRLVIVTTDLIGVTRQLREAVLQRVNQKHDLPPAGLMLNASHTHCGPEVRLDRLVSDQQADPEYIQRNRQYVAELEDRLVEVVGKALAKLAPADLSWSFARAGFAMNRRGRPTPDGMVHRGPYPEGPIDHRVPVLRVDRPDDQDDQPHAILFMYACHATSLNFFEISGDWPGYAQQYLQEHRPETTALFLTGCAADQNPYPRREVVPGQSALDLAKQHGRTLANAVETALRIAEQKPVRGPLHVAVGEAELTFQPPPSQAELEQQAESSNRWNRQYARRLLEMKEADGLIDRYGCCVHVARFGDDLLLIGIAGEVVVDYSLRLQQELGPHTWVAGYTNDMFGYLPSQRVLREGGYEGGGHTRFTNFPGPFDESVEQHIAGKVYQLIDQTGGEVPPEDARMPSTR